MLSDLPLVIQVPLFLVVKGCFVTISSANPFNVTNSDPITIACRASLQQVDKILVQCCFVLI